ncbi:MAG: hypothetical protein JSW38_02025 [Dehalococcoidia bacterium]|nr:MAG: hypothetical protein JSW38_02025 [Dehalococcoidia bacterium]
MKKMDFVLIALLTVVTLFAVGCGGDEDASPTSTASPEATTTPEVTATPVPTQPPDELSQLLGKTAGIESVKYTMVMNTPGLPEGLTSEVWQESGKMKTQTTVMDQSTVTYADYDAQRMCTCFEATCMSMDFSQAPPDPMEQSETIAGYEPTVIGSETINGKDCLVFEWTAEGVQTKWWVDKDSGWPVRVESTGPQGTTVIEYTDLIFGDIPDSVFVFPPAC